MNEPQPVDHMDEPGEYRAQVRASVLGRVGGGEHAEPVTDRGSMVGTWSVSFDRSLVGQPPAEAFTYHLRSDGTSAVEGTAHGADRSEGEWRLNPDGTFSLLTWCPPMPEYGIDEPALDEARYHLIGLPDGRRALWNGDGSLVLLLSPSPSPSPSGSG